MRFAPIPEGDEARVECLLSHGILDTPAEEDYDVFVDVAAELFKVPMAKISLLDADRQWFKAKKGVAERETPRNISFCGHAILHDEVLVVPDTVKDERFFDNPLVLGEPFIRFYAGAPLRTYEGHRIGVLCVMDTKPRAFELKDIRLLERLGRAVVTLLEAKKSAVPFAQLARHSYLCSRRSA